MNLPDNQMFIQIYSLSLQQKLYQLEISALFLNFLLKTETSVNNVLV